MKRPGQTSVRNNPNSCVVFFTGQSRAFLNDLLYILLLSLYCLGPVKPLLQVPQRGKVDNILLHSNAWLRMHNNEVVWEPG